MTCAFCGKQIKKDDYGEYVHVETGAYSCRAHTVRERVATPIMERDLTGGVRPGKVERRTKVNPETLPGPRPPQ